MAGRSRGGRALAVGCVVIGLLPGCGSDDDGDGGSASAPGATTTPASAGATTPASAGATTPASAGATTPSSSSPGGEAPATSAAPSSAPASTTAAAGVAAQALLTPADLPGWTVTPDDGDSGGGLTFEDPACAAVQALDDDPALADDATVQLVSPDGTTQVQENISIGDPAAIQRAFGVFAAPETAPCLQAAITAVLQRPGAMPAGATLAPVTVQQQPVAAGDEAVSYVADVSLTGAAATVTFPVRMTVVRHGGGLIALLMLTAPPAAPPDLLTVVTPATERLVATIG